MRNSIGIFISCKYLCLINGNNVTVADAPQKTDDYNLKPGWNKIPIVPETATRVNLMIVNPSLDGANTAYGSTFYIDAIEIGEVKSDIYINDDTTVTVKDDAVDCSVVITNAKSEADIEATVFVAAYEDGKCVGVSAKAATILATGDAGVSTTLVNTSVPTDGATNPTVRIFVMNDNMAPITLAR